MRMQKPKYLGGIENDDDDVEHEDSDDKVNVLVS